MGGRDTSENVVDPVEIVTDRHEFLVSVGIASIVVGVLIIGWVGYEWYVVRIGHQVMALVGGVALLFGMQLLIFSFMTSMLVRLHREQETYHGEE